MVYINLGLLCNYKYIYIVCIAVADINAKQQQIPSIDVLIRMIIKNEMGNKYYYKTEQIVLFIR